MRPINHFPYSIMRRFEVDVYELFQNVIAHWSMDYIFAWHKDLIAHTRLHGRPLRLNDRPYYSYG